MKAAKKRPTHKQIEKEIHKLAKAGKVVFAPTDEIEKYEPEIEQVMDKILHLDSWLVTDISELSDFVNTTTLPAAKDSRTEKEILKNISTIFGLFLPSTRITLVELCQKIRIRQKELEQH